MEVEGRDRRRVWDETLGGNRRAVWVRGARTSLGRSRQAVVAHATAGTDLRFSVVPMDSAGHIPPEEEEGVDAEGEVGEVREAMDAGVAALFAAHRRRRAG